MGNLDSFHYGTVVMTLSYEVGNVGSGLLRKRKKLNPRSIY